MKTLLVLSALAAVAVAAPSFLAKDQKNTFPENWPEYSRRDKKSPQGYFFAESAPLNIGTPVHEETEFDGSSPSARTLGLKKHFNPTIIKKPTGYHLYRDSAEERAQSDPSEDCSKQVKVKFCGGEKIARSTNEDHEDVESSIKMAKEAIEHLQRDLKSIEHSPKSASWNEHDVNMHEDIEVARKALDHIHRNFGNLESMSLHSTLVNENPAHLTNADTVEKHEERASQWKEHVNTFKSNVEGARNMEDIMKSADHHESSANIENIDTTKLMKNSETTDHLLHKALLMKESHERDAIANTKTMSEMATAPTEIKESKLEHQQLISQKSADAMDLKNVKQDSLKSKASDLHASEKSLVAKETTHQDSMMRANEDHHEIELPKNMLEEKTINKEHVQGKASVASEKAVFNKDHHESHVDAKLRAPENHHDMELNKPGLFAPAISQGLEKNEHFRKTSEQEWNQNIEKHLKQPKNSLIETELAEHSTDVMKKHFDNSHLHEEKKMGHFETSMKSAEAKNMLEATNEHHEIMNIEKHITPTHMSSLKSAEHVLPAKDLTETHMRWAPERNEHLETTHMKAATEFHNQHPQSTHMLMHHQMDPAMESSHHFNTMGHPIHGHPMNIHEHEHVFSHAKAADLQSSNIMDHAKSAAFDGFMPHGLPSGLIDLSGKSAMDMMQWSHKSDGGRSAYGAYGGSGINIGGGGSGINLGGGAAGGAGGAVGVFPSAHVGNCAVPLLLSCSPSVVSGSLTKSGYGPSYGAAPAYRATEELNFHNKRDAKKTKEVANKKIIKQRTNIADKKQ